MEGFLHIGYTMRTNIEIDDKLMKQAQRLSGLKTKRAVIDAALEMFVRVQRQLLQDLGRAPTPDGATCGTYCSIAVCIKLLSVI